MSTFSIMNNKKEEIIKSILKSHLKINNNLFLSEKLFVAKSAINWIFDNTKYPDVIKHYLKDVEKYLKGELLLSWSNGVLIKKKVKTNDTTEKEKK
jgi:hypothetical protein